MGKLSTAILAWAAFWYAVWLMLRGRLTLWRT